MVQVSLAAFSSITCYVLCFHCKLLSGIQHFRIFTMCIATGLATGVFLANLFLAAFYNYIINKLGGEMVLYCRFVDDLLGCVPHFL